VAPPVPRPARLVPAVPWLPPAVAPPGMRVAAVRARPRRPGAAPDLPVPWRPARRRPAARRLTDRAGSPRALAGGSSTRGAAGAARPAGRCAARTAAAGRRLANGARPRRGVLGATQVCQARPPWPRRRHRCRASRCPGLPRLGSPRPGRPPRQRPPPTPPSRPRPTWAWPPQAACHRWSRPARAWQRRPRPRPESPSSCLSASLTCRKRLPATRVLPHAEPRSPAAGGTSPRQAGARRWQATVSAGPAPWCDRCPGGDRLGA
jgi:hypothetical protein